MKQTTNSYPRTALIADPPATRGVLGIGRIWTLGIICIGLAAAAIGLPVVAEAGNSGDGAGPPVVLRRGEVGRLAWTATAHRSPGREGAKRPCLRIASRDLGTSSSPPSAFEGSTVSCGHRGEVSLTVIEGEGEERATIFAFAFPSKIRSVELILKGVGPQVLKTHHLTARQRARSGLGGMQYVAFASLGAVCLERLITFDAGGRVVSSDAESRCAR